ncbi:MAG: GHMP kinase [Chloroflexi bacterium]|nr:GHMP kinase [Chloroflexota bacterium]MCY3937077.1 GHMP kinase [Chloroflexota bacterium]
MRRLTDCNPERGVASVPGTCGELAQGMLDGTLVMVTCPIDLFATATVELSEGAGRVRGPAGSPKAARAVELSLARLGRNNEEARLHLESPLPRGKGMASSTADIVAAVGATAAALNTETTVRQQADLALAIEPSDGVMLPGIALFDHRYGRIAQSLGNPPGMRVLVLEFADALDTEAFNAVDRKAELHRREAHFREALDLITVGLKNGDDEMIGRGATHNALAYQEVLPKPQLPDVLALGRAAGAVGVNVAHSGTVLGLLFPEDFERADWAAEEAWKRLSNLTAVHNRRLIGGGIVRHHQRET